jgi:hypothetical protein
LLIGRNPQNNRVAGRGKGAEVGIFGLWAGCVGDEVQQQTVRGGMGVQILEEVGRAEDEAALAALPGADQDTAPVSARQVVVAGGESGSDGVVRRVDVREDFVRDDGTVVVHVQDAGAGEAIEDRVAAGNALFVIEPVGESVAAALALQR